MNLLKGGDFGLPSCLQRCEKNTKQNKATQQSVEQNTTAHYNAKQHITTQTPRRWGGRFETSENKVRQYTAE